jgi:hypothetical protein
VRHQQLREASHPPHRIRDSPPPPEPPTSPLEPLESRTRSPPSHSSSSSDEVRTQTRELRNKQDGARQDGAVAVGADAKPRPVAGKAALEVNPEPHIINTDTIDSDPQPQTLNAVLSPKP